MLHAAGITPGRARVPGARSPVAFLSAEQLAQLDAVAARMASGATVAEAAGAALSRIEPARAGVRPSQPEPAQVDAQAGLSKLEALALCARACRDLLSTGQPITTSEAAALLLAHPHPPAARFPGAASHDYIGPLQQGIHLRAVPQLL